MPRERIKIGTRPLTPYGGSEPVFIEVPFKLEDHEKFIVDDPNSLQKVSDEIASPFHEQDSSVSRVAEYGGFVCTCHQPHSYWRVQHAVDGSELSPHLHGQFTGIRNLKKAIDGWKDGQFGTGVVQTGKKPCNFGE